MNLLTTLRGLSPRARLLAALGVVAVVAAVVLAVTLGGSDGSPSSNAGATTSAAGGSGASASASDGSGSGSATSSSAAATPGDPNQPPPSLPAVALDGTADAGDGVSARLTAIDAIQGEAGGPGQVAGPALRVTVRILNGSSADISLDGVAVNLAYGADNTPGSPIQDSSAAPFTGSLPAGDEAEAVYVFSVPEDSRDVVTVEVGYQPGAPLMIFSGAVD
jgi:hypothetical protein